MPLRPSEVFALDSRRRVLLFCPRESARVVAHPPLTPLLSLFPSPLSCFQNSLASLPLAGDAEATRSDLFTYFAHTHFFEVLERESCELATKQRGQRPPITPRVRRMQSSPIILKLSSYEHVQRLTCTLKTS